MNDMPDDLQRPSVLRRLKEKTGSNLDLHLHDQDEESDVPVKIDDDAKALRDPSGRYQVLGEIGRGGVGVVYKGRDQDLGRDVALKVLRPEHVSRPEIVERFVEEAQIGGQLQHPGSGPVYELGLMADEQPYFHDEAGQGPHARVVLPAAQDAGRQTRTPARDLRVCLPDRGLRALESVLHRDLKPALPPAAGGRTRRA